MTDITVPQDLWDSEDEGVILTWVYQTGATVAKGALLAELMVRIYFESQSKRIYDVKNRINFEAESD